MTVAEKTRPEGSITEERKLRTRTLMSVILTMHRYPKVFSRNMLVREVPALKEYLGDPEVPAEDKEYWFVYDKRWDRIKDDIREMGLDLCFLRYTDLEAEGGKTGESGETTGATGGYYLHESPDVNERWARKNCDNRIMSFPARACLALLLELQQRPEHSITIEELLEWHRLTFGIPKTVFSVTKGTFKESQVQRVINYWLSVVECMPLIATGKYPHDYVDVYYEDDRITMHNGPWFNGGRYA